MDQLLLLLLKKKTHKSEKNQRKNGIKTHKEKMQIVKVQTSYIRFIIFFHKFMYEIGVWLWLYEINMVREWHVKWINILQNEEKKQRSNIAHK